MIGILGAGSLGRLWAASLPAGRVAFIPRPAQQPQPDIGIRYRFRPFHGPESIVQVPWLQAADSPELILVTTKAGDTCDAIAGVIDRFAETTPLVLFQNGQGSQQAVAARWPDHPILAASTTEGANRPEPDLLVHAGTGDTWVGPLTDTTGQLNSVVSLLRAGGLTIHKEPDILGRLWQKLIINAGINAYTALLDCPNGDILAAPLYQQTIDSLCQELSAVMRASGQPKEAPDTLRQRIEAVAHSTARNTSSMRADVREGRRTEIDFINGYLARLGKQLGIATPVNQMLTQQVKQLSPYSQGQHDGQSPFQDLHPHRR